MGVQNAWVFSTNHKTTRDWVVSLVENTHAFCTRTIIGRKQGYKMREYFLLENIERKFGWKSVSIFYHFDRTISSGIKKVAEKAQKNCFPLLQSGTKKYIICPNDDLLLWTSQYSWHITSLSGFSGLKARGEFRWRNLIDRSEYALAKVEIATPRHRGLFLPSDQLKHPLSNYSVQERPYICFHA